MSLTPRGLDIVGFIDEVGRRLDLSLSEADADASLRDELMFDSLLMAEFTLVLSELGAPAPRDAFGALATLRQAFGLYELRVSQGVSASDANIYLEPVSLVPIADRHLDALYHVCCEGGNAPLWRFRSTTPSRQEFIARLWDRVAVQFVVSAAGEVDGLVCAYELSPHGHVHVGVVVAEHAQGSGLGIEATAIFIDYLFQNFDLQKVCFQSHEPSVDAMATGIGRQLRLTGRLRNDAFINGCYRDLLLFEITRDEWAELSTRMNAVGLVDHG